MKSRREKKAEYTREYYKKNKEKIKEARRKRMLDPVKREKKLLYDRERNKEYRKNNPEKIRKKEEAYKEKNRENSKKWRISNRKKEKERHLKAQYNISLEEYELLFFNQNGNCAICSINQSLVKKSLVVDHCHKTGKIRGLLCNSCNLGLGMFKDEYDFVHNAAKYLEKYKKEVC